MDTKRNIGKRFLEIYVPFVLLILILNSLNQASKNQMALFSIAQKNIALNKDKIIASHLETHTPTKGIILNYSNGVRDTFKRTSIKDFCKKNGYVMIERGRAVHRDYSCLEETKTGDYFVYTIDNYQFRIHPNYTVNIQQAIRNNCDDL